MMDAEMPAVSRSFCSLAALGQKFSNISALVYLQKVTINGTFSEFVPGFEGASAFARLDHHAAAHRVLVNCACLCAHRIVCVQHVACLHADAGRFLPAARTGVFAKPCGLARATYKAHESAQQTSMSVVSSVLGRRSPTNEESNRSLVHTTNAHHLALDAAAFGAAVATSLPAVFFSMP